MCTGEYSRRRLIFKHTHTCATIWRRHHQHVRQTHFRIIQALVRTHTRAYWHASLDKHSFFACANAFQLRPPALAAFCLCIGEIKTTRANEQNEKKRFQLKPTAAYRNDYRRRRWAHIWKGFARPTKTKTSQSNWRDCIVWLLLSLFLDPFPHY